VLVVGTDQWITSGPAAKTAALKGRIHGCTRTFREYVRFFSLAPRDRLKRREFVPPLGGAATAWPQQPAEQMRGRLVVMGLIVVLCLAGLGFIDPWAIAQEVVGQYRWQMAMDPTVLTVEQAKEKAAKPGSDFKECANGCPAMIVIPAGKFIMGSPENESDRRERPRGRSGLIRCARNRRGLHGSLDHRPATTLIHPLAHRRSARANYPRPTPRRCRACRKAPARSA
jgi:hypothetical protein